MFQCCICLDDGLSSDVAMLLPCCGRTATGTGMRCCRLCLRRVCTSRQECPACRSRVIWDEASGTAMIMPRADTALGELLRRITVLSIDTVGLLLNILLSPLRNSFDQALAAVLSRGAV